MTDGSGDRHTPMNEASWVELDLQFPSVRQFEEEFAPNLAYDGIFIPSETPLAPSSVVRFHIKLPDDFVLLEGTGVVFWTRAAGEVEGLPGGMALRFATMSDRNQDMVDRFVQSHIARGGRPFDLQPVSDAGDGDPTDAPAGADGSKGIAPPAEQFRLTVRGTTTPPQARAGKRQPDDRPVTPPQARLFDDQAPAGVSEEDGAGESTPEIPLDKTVPVPLPPAVTERPTAPAVRDEGASSSAVPPAPDFDFGDDDRGWQDEGTPPPTVPVFRTDPAEPSSVANAPARDVSEEPGAEQRTAPSPTRTETLPDLLPAIDLGDSEPSDDPPIVEEPIDDATVELDPTYLPPPDPDPVLRPDHSGPAFEVSLTERSVDDADDQGDGPRWSNDQTALADVTLAPDDEGGSGRRSMPWTLLGVAAAVIVALGLAFTLLPWRTWLPGADDGQERGVQVADEQLIAVDEAPVVSADETQSPQAEPESDVETDGGGAADVTRQEAGIADGAAVDAAPRPDSTAGDSTSESPPVMNGRASRIDSISWMRREDRTAVTLRANGQLEPDLVAVIPMADPPRLLIRLRWIEAKYRVYTMDVGTEEVSLIRTGLHPEMTPPALYVVLDLTGDDVRVVDQSLDGSTLTVLVGR